MAETSFTRLVGCTSPVQQAPMGSLTPPAVALAVAAAGGLGTLPAFGLSPEDVVGLGAEARGGPGALALNVLIPIVDRSVIEAASEAVRVVDFFWGDPDPKLVDVARRGGALACWQVGSAERARMAVGAGCDFVIAQGTEAGGHHDGDLPLLAVLDETLDAVEVPVLAAGGIGSARQVAAALAAGAAGVRCGTRFVAAEESTAHPAYVDALISAGAADAVRTDRFHIGCPLCPSNHGVLRQAIERAEALGGRSPGRARMPDGTERDLPPFAGAPPLAGFEGEHPDAMCLYAGRSVAGVKARRPAAEIVRELTAGT